MILVDPGKKKRLHQGPMGFPHRKVFIELFPLFSRFTDAFFEDFCCGMKSKLSQDPAASQIRSERGSAEPPNRTDSQCGDPGGAGTKRLHPPLLENKSVLELKKSQLHYGPDGGCPPGNPSANAASAGGQTHHQESHQLSSHPVQPQCPAQLTSPPRGDADSALEAAVNSILEC